MPIGLDMPCDHPRFALSPLTFSLALFCAVVMLSSHIPWRKKAHPDVWLIASIKPRVLAGFTRPIAVQRGFNGSAQFANRLIGSIAAARSMEPFESVL